MIKEYITVKQESHTEFVEKRSTFIGHIYNVNSIQEADDIIQNIKNKYSDARHNVFAYKIGDFEKYSDDGEPQGTAGLPILSVIRKNSINNCIILVTRYFGGVLLGAPGLVRAYTTTATKAIENCEFIKKQLYNIYHVKCTYQQYKTIQNLIKKDNFDIKKIEFGDHISFDIYIPYDKNDWFETNFINAYNVVNSCDFFEEKFI